MNMILQKQTIILSMSQVQYNSAYPTVVLLHKCVEPDIIWRKYQFQLSKLRENLEYYLPIEYIDDVIFNICDHSIE